MTYKKHDWFAATYFSPDKTPQDLANLGITPDTSTLLDKDSYKEMDAVKKQFINESGEFDDRAFTNAYNGALELWNYAENEKITANLAEMYEYDAYNYTRPLDSKIRDTRPILTEVINPFGQNRGAINFRQASAPTLSVREAAQKSLVFNVDTQSFEKWTPNDWGGLSALTRPALVLAQWETDGEEIINGRTVSHKKGDLKFNDKGNPYYETLGSRDLAGKDLLHIADTFTVDGSAWNKYDIFDSDGLDKSISRSVAKTAVKLIPFFIPGVNTIYTSLIVAQNLGSALPALYKSIEGIATDDISKSKSAQTVTNIEAWFKKFDTSMSDYARNKFMSIENLGNLISASMGQLYSQQNIAKLPNLIKKLSGGTATVKGSKLGSQLAVTYMAGISSAETFDAFRAAGASDRIAGLGALSVGALYHKLMNTDYFKSVWMPEGVIDSHKAKSLAKKAADHIVKTEYQNVKKDVTQKGLAKSFIDIYNKTNKYITSLKPGDLVYDSINEGIEETMEEIGSDMVKGIYSFLNYIGIADRGSEYDFGFTGGDMLSRYITSFIGGGIGGSVFSLRKRFDSNNVTGEAIKSGGDPLSEVIYYIRDGKANIFRNELKKLHDSGKLASTNLSGIDFELTDDKKINYLSAKEQESQNDIVYKHLNSYVDRIEAVLKEENLNISDEELSKLTSIIPELSDATLEERKNWYISNMKDAKFEVIKDAIITNKLYSTIYDDWHKLTMDIVQTKVALEQMLQPKDGEKSESKSLEDKLKALENNAEYQSLKEKLNNLRKQRDELIKGSKNDYYAGQLLFAVTPGVRDWFVEGIGVHNYTRWKHHKDYDKLSDSEKLEIDAEYDIFSKSDEKLKTLNAFEVFQKMSESLIKQIETAGNNARIKNSLISNHTEYGSISNYLNTQIEQKLKELKKLEESDDDNSDKILELEAQINKLKSQQESLDKFIPAYIRPMLTDEGSKVLNRPSEGNDVELSFSNYTSSYLNFLQHINDNGLYVDVVDSDLLTIFKWYKSLLGSSPKETLVNNIQYWWSELFGEDVDEDVAIDLASELLDMLQPLIIGDVESAYNLFNNLGVELITYTDGARELTSEEKQQLFNKVLPQFGEIQFSKYLEKLINLRKQLNISPIYDLLSSTSEVFELETWNLVDLIKKEQLNLLSSKSIEDYLITNNWDSTKLEQTVQLINAIIGLLNASSDNGYNLIINEFREALKKELLPIIGTDSVINLTNDLNRLRDQLISLIAISNMNQAAKLREQKDIAKNMKKKFLEQLLSLEDQFSKEFGISLSTIKNSFGIPDDITDENFADYESLVTQFETEVFKIISGQNLNSDTLAKKLLNLFNLDSISKGKPTKLTKDPNVVVSDYDMLIYLSTILSSPTINFINDAKTVVQDSAYDKTPTFAQEFADRIIYSRLINPSLFKNILKQIKQHNSNNPDSYIKSKTAFDSFVVVFGGAGTGKTTSVAKLITSIFSDAEIITVAPSQNQVNILTNNIGNVSKSFTKHDLIKSIIGHSLSDKDMISIADDSSMALDPKITIGGDLIFGDSKQKILVLDEISLFTRPELEVLNKWANKNNITIIGLGDYRQNSKSINDSKNPKIKYHTGILDGFIIKSSDLIAPMRPDNIAKSDNYFSMLRVLDEVYENYWNNPSILDTSIQNITTALLSEQPITFKYFDDGNNFGGEKIILQSDVRKWYNRLSKLSNKVVIIIGEDKRDYNDLDPNVIKTAEEIQGDEYDYVIIDKTFTNDYDQLKDIYTLTQRSKKGTLIVGGSLGNLYKDKLDNSSSGSIVISQSQLDEYKNEKLNVWNKIPTQKIEISTNAEPSNQTNDNDSTNTVVTENDEIQQVEEISVPKIAEVSPKNEEIVKPKIEEISASKIVQTSKIVKPKNVSPHSILMDSKIFLKHKDNWVKLLREKLNLGDKDNMFVWNVLRFTRMFYLNGYYKKNINNLTEFVRKAVSQHLKGNQRDLTKTIISLLTSNPDFEIVNFDKDYNMLVVNINNVSIPLTVTPLGNIGKYKGDIQLTTALNHGDSGEISELDLEDDTLNPYHTVFSYGMAISRVAKEQELTGGALLWNSKFNNGNTFLITSEDPFLSSEDITMFLSPKYTENILSDVYSNDDRISLIGLNRSVTLEELVQKCKNWTKGKTIPITGKRFSQLLSVLFLHPEYGSMIKQYVTEYVQKYIKNKNAIKIYKNGEEFIFKEDSNIDLSNFDQIEFGYIDSDGFKINWNASRDCKEIFTKINFLQNLQYFLSENGYQNGIFIPDDISRMRTDTWGELENPDSDDKYVSNATITTYSVYSIDSSKIETIDNVVESNNQSKSVENQLHTFGIDVTIDSDSEIPTVIDRINQSIIRKINNPKYSLFEYHNGIVSSVEYDDPRYMINNHFGERVNIIELNYQSGRKFNTFLVSLQNGEQIAYSMHYINGKWEINQYPGYNLHNMLLSMSQKQPDQINDYVLRLLNHEHISHEIAKAFSDYCVENSISTIELREVLTNYLITKLQNDDC